MPGKKSKHELDERLDRLGLEVVRSAASNETEAEGVAASPFLYARIRSRIKAEQERRETGECWLTLLGVAWRAVPAMVLVAVFALALFWSAGPVAQPAGSFNVEALLGPRDAGIEQVVFADANTLSNDEVLATILNEDEREAAR